MSWEQLKLETSNMAWLNLYIKTADILNKQNCTHFHSHRSKTAKMKIL